jgi:hypothetical protein
MAIPKGKKGLSSGHTILIWFRRLGLYCRPGGDWQVCPPIRSSG